MTQSKKIRGLPPLLGEQPRILVLGSMPSVASLEKQQYYGHPRNAFWPIMAELLNFPTHLPYLEKAERITQHGIAVWDVIGECVRPGSLDSSIVRGSEQINPIPELLTDRPGIHTIALNGGTAAKLFRRQCLPLLAAEGLRILTLPSTSPAFAGMRFAQKCAHWHTILKQDAPFGEGRTNFTADALK